MHSTMLKNVNVKCIVHSSSTVNLMYFTVLAIMTITVAFIVKSGCLHSYPLNIKINKILKFR